MYSQSQAGAYPEDLEVNKFARTNHLKNFNLKFVANENGEGLKPLLPIHMLTARTDFRSKIDLMVQIPSADNKSLITLLYV